MKKNTLIFTSIIAFTSIIFTSCVQKKDRIIISQGEVKLSNSTENISSIQTQTWHCNNKKTVVLFGYGFNSPDFVQETLSNLSIKFGLAENSGKIIPLVYPEDFKNGSKTNISLLIKKLSGTDLDGVVILGSPEGTSQALTRFSDTFGKPLPFPVISAFSQDEPLSTEYISTIVIDKDIKIKLNGTIENTEEELTIIPDIQNFIENAVKFCINIQTPPEKDKNLLKYAENISKNHKVSRYIDAETGLYSINHFYID